MTPTRSLLCACRVSALAPVAARRAGQNQGVQGYSPMFLAALEAAGISRDQIQTMGRETPAALLMG